eukprot:gene2415-2931_t
MYAATLALAAASYPHEPARSSTSICTSMPINLGWLGNNPSHQYSNCAITNFRILDGVDPAVECRASCCTNTECRSWGLDIEHQGNAPGCVDGKPCCWLDKCAGLEQSLLKNCSWGCVSGRSGRADDPTQCKTCTSASCNMCAAGPPPPPPPPSPPTTGRFTVDLG